MAVYKLEGSEEDVTVLSPEETGGEDPGVKTAKSSEFREGEQ